MGDPGLRCVGCAGKFGPLDLEDRCAVCGPLFRLGDLILSDQFPASGAPGLINDLRQIYVKALVSADNYRRDQLGGEVPPGPAQGETKPELRELQPKRKPQPPLTGGREESKEVKEEKPCYSPEESPEKKDKRRRSAEREAEVTEETRRRAERSPLPRSHRETSPRRRSRSPQSSHRTRREDREADLDRSRGGREKKYRPRSEERTERRRGDSHRKSPIRPRSPDGPPPPREREQDRWKGPIPSYHKREGWVRYPEAENKGIKKRKQQALFAEFKAWKKNYRSRR